MPTGAVTVAVATVHSSFHVSSRGMGLPSEPKGSSTVPYTVNSTAASLALETLMETSTSAATSSWNAESSHSLYLMLLSPWVIATSMSAPSGRLKLRDRTPASSGVHLKVLEVMPSGKETKISSTLSKYTSLPVNSSKSTSVLSAYTLGTMEITIANTTSRESMRFIVISSLVLLERNYKNPGYITVISQTHSRNSLTPKRGTG